MSAGSQQTHESRKFVVARASDVPDNGRLLVHVRGRAVAVFHVGDEYFALLDRCPHQGGPLCRGDLLGLIESDYPGRYRFEAEKTLIACPWHGWEFDLRTGQSYFDPAHTRARFFPIEVERGARIAPLMADDDAVNPSEITPGPYVAESFPISLERDYLVITMRV
jgi:3-phenylpropionate/trans-cinnamate dioxygenase ferredoxin subunit